MGLHSNSTPALSTKTEHEYPPGCLSFTSCKISLTHPILRNTIILTILTMYLIDWLNKCHMMYHFQVTFCILPCSYQAILISGHFYQ